MPEANDLAALINNVGEIHIDAVKSHWVKAQSAEDSINKFDNFSKGWDRLSCEIWPENDGMGYRFKRLTGLCTTVASSTSIDDLLFEVDGPIKNDMERLERDAQRDFDRAQKNLRNHRSHRLADHILMESIGSLLWTVRSNSMHGRKTSSGPVGPTNRDEQICELGAAVLAELYRAAFPNW
jgi:hypothetical protein